MKFIIAKKLKMSQVFLEDGTVRPVTVVQAGPCQVSQVKAIEKDGYTALQIGFGTTKHIKKPQQGHLKSVDTTGHLKEFRTKSLDNVHVGDLITVSTFTVGDKVKVTGVSKGKGFQGVVKRHGFSGSLKTHGHKDQLRMPGSIGAGEPQHVFKGTRMGGHMGDDQVTVSNITVEKIDEVNNLLYLRGAVPGAKNGIIYIAGTGDLKLSSAQNQKTEDSSAVEEKVSEESTPTEEVTPIEETVTVSEEVVSADAEENKEAQA